MRVLHVASELYPLLKTGGLADVVGALPLAQQHTGTDARVLVPGFPGIRHGLQHLRTVAEIGPRFGAEHVRLSLGELPGSGLPVYMIDAPHLFDRPGNPYSGEDKREYEDNYRRFALLGWMAAQLAQGLDGQWTPAVLHCHDWHAGLAPAYLQAAREIQNRRIAASVITVHNLAYQGVFPGWHFAELDLPPHFFAINGAEYYGNVSFLKAGLYFADRITTVSPTYAHEIQQAEQGCGLDGLLRRRSGDLVGILNGVDAAVWNPADDVLLPAHYGPADISGKADCKARLQQATGLAVKPDAPLFCVVSRLTEQKGLHLVLGCLPELLARGGQLALIGSGDPHLERAFRDAAAAHPDAVSVNIGYDEPYAHALIGGSDVIMVPSRFEPCGLTQLYGLKYGTLPLVRRVGGLADTVVDTTLENLDDGSATGFVFDHFSIDGISTALRRAFALYRRRDDWHATCVRAMTRDFGWEASAERYARLYQDMTHGA
jgi:starch synthase